MHHLPLTPYLAKTITDDIARSANQPGRRQAHELRIHEQWSASRAARRRRRAR